LGMGDVQIGITRERIQGKLNKRAIFIPYLSTT
jgi:hypothetical protein